MAIPLYPAWTMCWVKDDIHKLVLGTIEGTLMKEAAFRYLTERQVEEILSAPISHGMVLPFQVQTPPTGYREDTYIFAGENLMKLQGLIRRHLDDPAMCA